MSLFDGKPIGRIDLNPRRIAPVNVGPEFSYSPAECDRIWKLVRMAAEATNMSSAPVSEPEAFQETETWSGGWYEAASPGGAGMVLGGEADDGSYRAPGYVVFRSESE